VFGVCFSLPSSHARSLPSLTHHGHLEWLIVTKFILRHFLSSLLPFTACDIDAQNDDFEVTSCKRLELQARAIIEASTIRIDY